MAQRLLSGAASTLWRATARDPLHEAREALQAAECERIPQYECITRVCETGVLWSACKYRPTAREGLFRAPGETQARP